MSEKEEWVELNDSELEIAQLRYEHSLQKAEVVQTASKVLELQAECIAMRKERDDYRACLLRISDPWDIEINWMKLAREVLAKHGSKQ